MITTHHYNQIKHNSVKDIDFNFYN